MPFDDDAADDVIGFRPPPHPDDRLWRHPSEVDAAEPSTPIRSHGRLWPWGIAAVGTAGVMLAGAGTLVLGLQDRASDGDQRQQAAVTPLGSAPIPRVEAQPFAPRSSEGVSDLTEIARLTDQLAPSLVVVEGDGTSGSGVVLGTDGVTLTSADLVVGREEVGVTLHDGRRVAGQVMGVDPLTGLAVLDLPGTHSAAVMADPTDVGAGEGVLAMGAVPGGGRPATTLGPLSRGHRPLVREGHADVDGLLHVDVPGQAVTRGGPLVDQHGMVIGITIWTEDAIYATPIDVAARVAGDVLTLGQARHAWLGIDGRDVGDDGSAAGGGPSTTVSTLAAGDAGPTSVDDRTGGVVVVTVDPEGPATDQLETGDVITQVDDEPVAAMADLTDAVRERKPGDTVDVTVERGEDDATVEITLAPRPADP